MRTYIIRRLFLIIPTLLIVTVIVFFLVRFIPGDVVSLMVDQMSAEGESMGIQGMTAQKLTHLLGLDVPIHIQYVRWLGNAFRGDLGVSLWRDYPITEELGRRLPVSFELGILALIIKLLISIPIGVWSAIRQDTTSDYIGRTIAIIFISVPSFWVATLVIVYPSIWWNVVPPLKYIPFAEDPIANLRQFIVPAIIMGMLATGTVMRMTRTMMLEVLRQDYIRTAWSKGLSEWMVITRHALKNALIPVITVIGISLPTLISGSVILEEIFVLPGIGRLLIEAVNQRDYPVISAINLIIALFILVINLLVDITYAYLDPRIHYR